jgi:hypothetical protein
VNVVIRLCCINTVTFMSTFYAVYVIHLTNHVKRNILSIFHHSWYLQVFPWYIIRLNIRSVRFYWWISVLVYDCWLVNSIPWIFQICWYLLYKSRCYCDMNVTVLIQQRRMTTFTKWLKLRYQITIKRGGVTQCGDKIPYNDQKGEELLNVVITISSHCKRVAW